jgi:U3 small nucleolar RNA-associated protein 14
MYTLCFTFRILKKEKLKLQLKEFEELKKKNPEEALEKLEALEKARALETHTKA